MSDAASALFLSPKKTCDVIFACFKCSRLVASRGYEPASLSCTLKKQTHDKAVEQSLPFGGGSDESVLSVCFVSVMKRVTSAECTRKRTYELGSGITRSERDQKKRRCESRAHVKEGQKTR